MVGAFKTAHNPSLLRFPGLSGGANLSPNRRFEQNAVVGSTSISSPFNSRTPDHGIVSVSAKKRPPGVSALPLWYCLYLPRNYLRCTYCLWKLLITAIVLRFRAILQDCRTSGGVIMKKQFLPNRVYIDWNAVSFQSIQRREPFKQ